MKKAHKLMSKHLEELHICEHFFYVQLMSDMTKKWTNQTEIQWVIAEMLKENEVDLAIIILWVKDAGKQSLEGDTWERRISAVRASLTRWQPTWDDKFIMTRKRKEILTPIHRYRGCGQNRSCHFPEPAIKPL